MAAIHNTFWPLTLFIFEYFRILTVIAQDSAPGTSERLSLKVVLGPTVVPDLVAKIGKIDNFCLPIWTNQERAPFVNLPTARLPIFPFSLKTLGLHIRPPLQIVIYNKHFTLKTVSISNKTYLQK